MTWNYRIIYHSDAPTGPWYGLHEVYYEGGKITGWTENPVTFVSDADGGEEGINLSLVRALQAQLKPVLVERDDTIVNEAMAHLTWP